MNVRHVSQADEVLAQQMRQLRLQRWQDFFFEKFTLIFATTTFVALIGIIASLVVSAWPALKAFGIPFFLHHRVGHHQF